MTPFLSESITLQTRAGEFTARHASVIDDNGRIVREGVLLASPKVADATQPVTVRVQSSCLFSESFWATDCDCALQLHRALEIIGEDGGYVLYFYEEGRGAGLLVKFQAIRLQQVMALGTRAAYEHLQRSPDDRSYDAAAAVLLEVLPPGRPIRLLTNNSMKVERLVAAGLNVTERVPHVVGAELPEIQKYLLDKRESLGHDISINEEKSED